MKFNYLKETAKNLCINTAKKQVDSMSYLCFHEVPIPMELQKLKKESNSVLQKES